MTVRSEDALRRALTQARRARDQADAARSVNEHIFARGVEAGLMWALGETSIDPFGGVGIHEHPPYMYERTEPK